MHSWENARLAIKSIALRKTKVCETLCKRRARAAPTYLQICVTAHLSADIATRVLWHALLDSISVQVTFENTYVCPVSRVLANINTLVLLRREFAIPSVCEVTAINRMYEFSCGCKYITILKFYLEPIITIIKNKSSFLNPDLLIILLFTRTLIFFNSSSSARQKRTVI